MPEASDERACQEMGGTWMPLAKDKKTCEEKGNRWVPNEDVVRDLEE